MGAKAKTEPPRQRRPKPPPGPRGRKPRPRGWGRPVGWHVGEDGEIHEGIAPWHRDVLLMLKETDSGKKRP